MNRIAVIGSAGSGKSVFSRKLAQRIGLPLWHLDALYWRAGWKPTPRDEWRALQRCLVEEERWIIDGNYGGSMELRLATADTVIYLDLPRWLCLVRVLKRWWQFRGGGRPDMVAAQRERLSLDFLLWIWRYPKRNRPDVLQHLVLQHLDALAPSTAVHRLQSTRAIEDFLQHVPGTAHP